MYPPAVRDDASSGAGVRGDTGSGPGIGAGGTVPTMSNGRAGLDGAEFFPLFLERFLRAQRVASEPAWRPGIVCRGVERLLIELHS